MSKGKTRLPSREALRAEREQVKAEVAQGRKLLTQSQVGIAEATQHFADSFDRLANSQKLVRS